MDLIKWVKTNHKNIFDSWLEMPIDKKVINFNIIEDFEIYLRNFHNETYKEWVMLKC